MQNDNTISLIEKINGLSLIWKEAEYNFPFWCNLIDEINWDEEYKKALDRVINTKNDVEYYLELCRFITLLKDDHTRINYSQKIHDLTGFFPVSFDEVDGKIYLLAKAANCEIPLLSELIAINDIPINEYLDKYIFPYCWHEIKSHAIYQMQMILPLVEYKKEVKFTTSNGEFILKATNQEQTWENAWYNMYLKEKRETLFASDNGTLHISKTHDDIAIITIPTFTNECLIEEFYSMLPELSKCKGYVIDLEWNNGGNSNYADHISQAFIEGPFLTSSDKSLMHISRYKAELGFADLSLMEEGKEKQLLLNIAKRKIFEEQNEIKTFIEKCPLTLKGPLAITMNRKTVSTGEHFLVTMDYNNRAILVGENSYGATGNPLFVNLANDISCRITTAWSTYPDGKEYVNIGVKPHVEIKITLEDIKNGRAKALERALEIVRSKINEKCNTN